MSTGLDTENESGSRGLDARRRSVKRILGAGGAVAGGQLVAGGWVKPLVSTVVLPAHAATSAQVDSLDDPCIITLTCTTQQTFDVQIDGSVEPPVQGVTVAIQIGTNGGGVSPLTQVLTDENGEYQASTNLSGLFSSVQVSVTLPDFPEAGIANCSVDTFSPGLNPGGGYYTSYGATYFCTSFGNP